MFGLREAAMNGRALPHLLIIALLLASVLIAPAALVRADDDDDDDGGGGGGLPPTIDEICAAASAPTNLVVNGDFEIPTVVEFLPYYAPAAPPGWALTEGSVDQVNASYWEAACLLQSMDLTGSPGQGTLTQSVSGTVLGQEYRLLFAYAANPDPNCELVPPPQSRRP